jgi:dTDP-4-dehydrorhamnose reductase
LVDNQVGAPTWCSSIAEATEKILAKIIESHSEHWIFAIGELSGAYNLSCPGQTSWYNSAKTIFGCVNPEASPKLTLIPSAEYPTPATRPKHSVLSKNKLSKTFEILCTSWEDGLKFCWQNNVEH